MVNIKETLSIKRLGLLREYHDNMTEEHNLLRKKFNSEIKKMSEVNTELKEIVSKSGLILDNMGENTEEPFEVESEHIVESEPETREEKNDQLKAIYRSLVKRTHPDKITDPFLNSVYIDAKKYYDNDDLLGLLILCENISHPYDIPIPVDEVNEETERLLENMKFMESSYVYKWHRASEEEKMDIIVRYIVQMTRTDMSPLSNIS